MEFSWIFWGNFMDISKEFQIEKVVIRVRKPHAPIKADFKNVEVELTRVKK